MPRCMHQQSTSLGRFPPSDSTVPFEFLRTKKKSPNVENFPEYWTGKLSRKVRRMEGASQAGTASIGQQRPRDSANFDFISFYLEEPEFGQGLILRENMRLFS